jgi:hypothetical protein
MIEDNRIPIMSQDVAAAESGIRGFGPSNRHITFARNAADVPRLRLLFQDLFGITLQEDYTTKRIGKRLGVAALSFSLSEGHGSVMSSEIIVEATNLNEVKSVLRMPPTPTSGPNK